MTVAPVNQDVIADLPDSEAKSTDTRGPPLSVASKDRRDGDKNQETGQQVSSHGSNEKKMSDGWRESAWLQVDGGISWKVRTRGCQPFAPSHG